MYGLAPAAGALPVRVLRFGIDPLPPGPPARGDLHSHAFLSVAWFERGGGTIRIGDERRPIAAGDLVLVPAAEPVAYRPPDARAGDVEGGGDGEAGDPVGWAVSFLPEALGAPTSGVHLAWRADPLLFPFVGDPAGSVSRRLSVPEDERPRWSAMLTAMHDEVWQGVTGGAGGVGHRAAVRAHLTLLLVAVARLANRARPDGRLPDDPLLARVFAIIEARYAEGISLADVAEQLHLTPGHVTTVVRERTGRTVLDWITERRLAEARRLLVQTGAPVGEVSRRVGYADPAYFSRMFRQIHGVTPSDWRSATAR